MLHILIVLWAVAVTVPATLLLLVITAQAATGRLPRLCGDPAPVRPSAAVEA